MEDRKHKEREKGEAKERVEGNRKEHCKED